VAPFARKKRIPKSNHLKRVRKAARAIQAKRDKRLPTKTESVFWPDHVDEVKAIAMSGCTDDEMAALMNISENLMQSWKAYYPRFAKAIDDGRTHADARVVAALHANAVGYEYETDEVVKTRRGADVVTVRKRFLPETAAQKFWLQNRDPARWNHAAQLTVGGKKDAPIGVKVEGKLDVIHSILNLITPRPDGDGRPPKLIEQD
jgi:hypothetical protein